MFPGAWVKCCKSAQEIGLVPEGTDPGRNDAQPGLPTLFSAPLPLPHPRRRRGEVGRSR